MIVAIQNTALKHWVDFQITVIGLESDWVGDIFALKVSQSKGLRRNSYKLRVVVFLMILGQK